mmetsp:Transcript_30751/g.43043  ORF Transcript_30751/g.43043 Transcript_30751/m.43043 type:complete len:329 (-) Transcript_30751:515-1501(-)
MSFQQSSIASMRGLFNKEDFRERLIGEHKIMAFHPNCGKEASLLLHWLEKGVFDALAKGYLDVVTFEIFHKNDPDPKNCELLERYNFKVMYPSETSSGGFSLSTNGNRLQTSVKSRFEFTQKEVVEATILLLRKLLTMGTTMKPLPKKRFLCMRLSYNEEITPLKYEPMFFRPAEEIERTTAFEFEPYSGELGTVSTRHHALSVKVQVNENMETEAITHPNYPGKMNIEDLGSGLSSPGSSSLPLSKTTKNTLHITKRYPNKESKSNEDLLCTGAESFEEHHRESTDKEIKLAMEEIYNLLDNHKEDLISENDFNQKLRTINPSVLKG